MPRCELQRAYKTDRLWFPFNVARFRWVGPSDVPIDPLIERNLQPDVFYSPNKQRRWELMDELNEFMNCRQADATHLFIVDYVDQFNYYKSLRGAITETRPDGCKNKTNRLRCGANTVSIVNERLQQHCRSTGNQQPGTVPDRDPDRATRMVFRRRNHHHRPHPRRGRRGVEIASESHNLVENSIPRISEVVFYQPDVSERRKLHAEKYFYEIRPRAKENKHLLKEYVREVNKADPKDLLNQVYASTNSDPDWSTGSECEQNEVDALESKSADLVDSEEEAWSVLEVETPHHLSNINPFLDKSKRVLTYPFPVRIDHFSWEQDPISGDRIVRVQIGTCFYGLSILCSNSSPVACAIELTALLKTTPRRARHVAYLVIEEPELQQAAASSDPSVECLCSVRLQIALSRDSRFIVKTADNVKSHPPTVSLNTLIHHAVEAVNQLPQSVIQWSTCQPYQNYTLDEGTDSSLDAFRTGRVQSIPHPSLNTADDEADSSFIIVSPEHLRSDKTAQRCCIGFHHCGVGDSVELCVHQHQACKRCLRGELTRHMDTVCCGITQSEVCWSCPHPQCNASLNRLAQLQVFDLARLVPVWKCADFLYLIQSDLVKHAPTRPMFYANPDDPGGCVATVWSGLLRATPSRSTKILFQPRTTPNLVWPKLYFTPNRKPDGHWPASCAAVRKYYETREILGDVAHISAHMPPDSDGMQPIHLPKPKERDRGSAYCNALRVAWRRNVLVKRYRENKQAWTDFKYMYGVS
ncbi:unnamed protein product [Echinostoma caproni]|uniref:ATP-dependent DNA helicase n=1 Tax=Echinostoma caproni TaxID=27848 RepID=A0A183B2R8_9TREM|nr:unnamed protein product [Echinostoma caproni]